MKVIDLGHFGFRNSRRCLKCRAGATDRVSDKGRTIGDFCPDHANDVVDAWKWRAGTKEAEG